MSLLKDSLNWTPIHDLAIIYQALAHGADANLDKNEIDTMAIKLNGWDDRFDIERTRKIMNEVLLVYVGESGAHMLETAIASVAQHLKKEDRITVLNDLADIASADGMIVMGEVSFIHHLAREWGIEKDIRA